MNNINLLSFLLTLQTQNIQHSALMQLLSHLQSENLDWSGVQNKIDMILAEKADLQTIYNQFKTQLEDNSNILQHLPEQETLDMAITRSALPTPPNKYSTEITNLAVVILRSENPQQTAQQKLQSLSEQLNRDKK